MILAGTLDIDASWKGARFVRFCDAFNIPLVFFTDVPGFLPGVDQEQNGIIKEGAKFVFSVGESTVPKINFVTRKSYGGSYTVMGCKELNTDFNFAWPTAELAVMGAKGAVQILFKGVNLEEEKKYEELFNNPLFAAKYGYIDDIVMPENSRQLIIDCLKAAEDKQNNREPRLHENCPL